MSKNTVLSCDSLPRCGSRILVVDDEKDIAFILKRALESYGFKVDAFDCPKSVLANFTKGSYDLVITDIRMPTMDGFELYKEIRKKDAKVKVCFLSAFEVYSEEFKGKVPSTESICLMEKPISINTLLEIVRRELQRDA